MSEEMHQIVVEGPLLLIRGYVAGLLTARGLDLRTVLFADELPIDCESALEQIAEWVHLHRNRSHLLVPLPLHAEMKLQLHKAEATLGLKVLADRLVYSGSIEFSYRAYHPRQAAELDAVLQKFTDRVRLSDDYRPVVRTDPSAAGVELYSPAHEYECTAKGTATGDVRTLLELHHQAATHGLMKLGKVRLNFASGA